MGIINSIFHIIESILSQEELPDFYEENLDNIAAVLTFVMETEFPRLQKQPIELVKARGKAVRVVHLYQFKFSEYFQKWQGFFFEKIWGMV